MGISWKVWGEGWETQSKTALTLVTPLLRRVTFLNLSDYRMAGFDLAVDKKLFWKHYVSFRGAVVRSFPHNEFVEFLVLADKDSTADMLYFSLCMHTYKPRHSSLPNGVFLH